MIYLIRAAMLAASIAAIPHVYGATPSEGHQIAPTTAVQLADAR